MLYKWLIISVSLISLQLKVLSQPEIDFENRMLIKTLQKYGIKTFAQLEEKKIIDDKIKSYENKGKFYTTNSTTCKIAYIYIGRVNSCRAGGCSASTGITINAQSEYFDYFILFDNLKNVLEVRVFNYQATHGQEITAKGWLKQFIGYNNDKKLQVNKNIDAISGATISVYAITSDIEQKTGLLNFLE